MSKTKIDVQAHGPLAPGFEQILTDDALQFIAGPAAVDNLVAYIKTMPVAPSAATITGDVAAGKATYAICAACHGPAGEGNEQLGGPKLAGQNDWYLVRQMNNYNGGLRGYDSSDIFGMQMKPMAATVNSPEAINNVVAYINSLQ